MGEGVIQRLSRGVSFSLLVLVLGSACKGSSAQGGASSAVARTGGGAHADLAKGRGDTPVQGARFHVFGDCGSSGTRFSLYKVTPAVGICAAAEQVLKLELIAPAPGTGGLQAYAGREDELVPPVMSLFGKLIDAAEAEGGHIQGVAAFGTGGFRKPDGSVEVAKYRDVWLTLKKGIRAAFEQKGLEVPRDIAAMGISGTLEAELSYYSARLKSAAPAVSQLEVGGATCQFATGVGQHIDLALSDTTGFDNIAQKTYQTGKGAPFREACAGGEKAACVRFLDTAPGAMGAGLIRPGLMTWGADSRFGLAIQSFRDGPAGAAGWAEVTARPVYGMGRFWKGVLDALGVDSASLVELKARAAAECARQVTVEPWNTYKNPCLQFSFAVALWETFVNVDADDGWTTETRIRAGDGLSIGRGAAIAPEAFPGCGG